MFWLLYLVVTNNFKVVFHKIIEIDKKTKKNMKNVCVLFGGIELSLYICKGIKTI
jgi:hypothetical protein